MLVSFLSIALDVSPKILITVPWWYCAKAFYLVALKTVPRIPLPLILELDDRPIKEEGWDYSGRSWHMYAHLLAKNYGWTLEYIANLKVEEALAKVQEILTDEQLEREFLWSSSEIAYSYDSKSQTSRFIPLNRPYWMRPKVVMPKKIKILKSLMPVGSVDYQAVGEYAPKDIKH